MSSQSNWNNPEMYYQQPQSGSGSGYGAQTSYPNASYGVDAQSAAFGADPRFAGSSQTYFYQPLPPTNSLAVVALVCSIAGLFMIPFIGGVAGVIMGHIAKKQISETGERGDGMVTGALWVGYTGTILWILGFLAIILFYLGMFALLFAVGSTS